MGDFLYKPVTIPESVVNRPEAAADDPTFVDIVEMADLNSPTLDCTFHDMYCLQRHATAYFTCLIACQPPFAFIQYKRKGACV